MCTYKTSQPRGKNHTSKSKESGFCICILLRTPSAWRQMQFITSTHCLKIKKNYVESMFKEGQHPSHSKSRIRISFFGDPSFPVHMRHMTWLRCPMLLRITKHSLHNKDICKLVNWAPIFFWYQPLRTTYGFQQFSKIGVVKDDYFVFPCEIFEVQVWIRY